ncbi:hypothetical protein DDI_1629 [Dickeya dianthicola RNS04.9]|nr:hypothetical protein DDI_1629 [Dickeya dianthicola RNS04.9]
MLVILLLAGIYSFRLAVSPFILWVFDCFLIYDIFLTIEKEIGMPKDYSGNYCI